MSEIYNPFKPNPAEVKETTARESRPRDPLDVQELLTHGTHKAVITADGELKLRSEAQQQKKPAVSLMKERYWGAMPASYSAYFAQQLAVESEEMKKHFPTFALRQAERDLEQHRWTFARAGQIFWLGSLHTYSRTVYQVAVAYPADYPFSEMAAYVLDPYLPTTEHRFVDGHLCLYDHQGKGKGFEERKTTAITIIAWAAAWLHSYEIWKKTAQWPILSV